MDHHKSGRAAQAPVSRGVWGHAPPEKFWKLEALKHHFQHSQAEICGKMALKIGDVYFYLKKWLSGNSTYTP